MIYQIRCKVKGLLGCGYNFLFSQFTALPGARKDNRSPEEIIEEIYALRHVPEA